MASSRAMGSGDASDPVEPVRTRRGYALGKRMHMKDVLDGDAELFESEGLDPTWPGFSSRPKQANQKPDKPGRD